MCKRFFGYLFFGIAALLAPAAHATDYGLPEKIQDGNILHCFNWSINDVRNSLPEIAEAGFGAVQLSPLQRRGVQTSHNWSDLYRPYDFAFQSTSALGSESDLKALCSEASGYGIKVIVDVVANHVDKATGYHDTWWNTGGRVRSWNGNPDINYNDRYSITHGRLGDYGEVNSENAEVIARAKAYVEWLRDAGVSGIRWDAAKHIGLPSESCDFWKEVTSVDGMYHYGEILGTPGPDDYKALMKEYAQYMSVTDSRYSEGAAHGNGGIATSRNGEWAPLLGADKVVYFGETHDTYSNTPEYGGWSANVGQSVIDRAYASVACRDGATALYLSRPDASGFGNIRVVKGNNHFTDKAVAEVNRFRNKMSGRSEYFSTSADGNSISVTRNNGGAVVVTKGTGSFSVPNGGALCPEGIYVDRVSGQTVTVTASTISGATGPTGIAVIYDDNPQAPNPDAPQQDYDSGYMTIYFDNTNTNWTEVYCHYWGGAETTSWPGKAMSRVTDNIYSVSLAAGSSVVFNNNNKGQQTVDVNNVKANHLYRASSTVTSGKYNVDDMDVYAAVDGVINDATQVIVRQIGDMIEITGLDGDPVTVAGIDGRLYYYDRPHDTVQLVLNPGIYVVRAGSGSQKIKVF